MNPLTVTEIIRMWLSTPMGKIVPAAYLASMIISTILAHYLFTAIGRSRANRKRLAAEADAAVLRRGARPGGCIVPDINTDAENRRADLQAEFNRNATLQFGDLQKTVNMLTTWDKLRHDEIVELRREVSRLKETVVKQGLTISVLQRQRAGNPGVRRSGPTRIK